MKLTVKTLLFAMTALLVSCSADDNDLRVGRGANDVDNESLLPIKLAVGDIPATRASDGLNQGKLPAGSNVTVVIDGKEYTFQTNADNAELTCVSSPVPYYPLDGSSVMIKAYYPAYSGWYNRTTEWNGGMSFDQSTDANYRISDRMQGTVSSSFLDTNGKVISTQNAVPITFKHLMAKVVLKITQPNDGTKITKVTLNSVKGRYKMCNGEYVANSAYFADNNTAGNYTLYTNTAGATGTVVCAGLFPPQTISKDVNFITVTTNENTIYYKLPQSVNFAAGQQYTYTLSTYVDKSGYKVGNVICTDGTMCEYSRVGDKTPVAVICYIGSDTGSATYKHGLALSLKGGISCKMDPSSSNYKNWDNREVYLNSKDDEYTDIDNIPVEDGLIYSGSPYFDYNSTYLKPYWPPYYYARYGFGTAPLGTSNWFLPSAYQWKQCLLSFGKTCSERYNTLVTFFSERGGEKFNSNYYWTCTRKSKYENWVICNSSVSKNGIELRAWYGVSNSANVRAMLAF